MRVLYLSYDGALDPLGRSQVIPYLAGLREKAACIDLLTFEKRKNLVNKNTILSLESELLQALIKWHHLLYHKNPVIPGTLFDIFLGTLAGLRIAIARKVQIVHARGYISAIIAVFLKKALKIKFIFDMRGLWPDEKIDAGAWKKGLVYKVMKKMERLFFARADWVIVLSHKGEVLLEQLFGVNGNLSVIPTCTDLELFSPKRKDEFIKKEIDSRGKFVFLYLGSVGTWYMLDEMIDLFRLAKAYFDAPLFLFLTNGEEGLIGRSVASKGLAKGDYFFKSVPYSEAGNWITQASASIFFIKPVFSKIVSCPTKFGESLACGLPVIINAGIGDTDEIVKKERVGVVVDEFSEAGYIKAIKELKQILEEGEPLNNRCRSVAERYFSLRDGIKKYQDIYEGLMQKR